MKNYRSLWILLAAGLAAIIALSAFSPVSICGYELKDSGIASALTRRHENLPAYLPEDTAAADEFGVVVAGVEAAMDEPLFPAETDTTAKTILFIGDSMLDGLYPRLAAYAAHNGHELYAVIWYSSTSEVWGRSGKLKQYVDKLQPNYIFICLGANELFVKDIAAKREKYVKQMLAEIGDIPYLWIGPPNWKPDTGINDLIRTHAARGSFFLSDGMTFERTKDGAHPTRTSAAQWMDSVVRWMPANSAHPIRMDVPSASSARAKKVFVHQPDEI